MSKGTGAASAAPEFPIVLAAVEEHEGTSKWKIADAILHALGKPPPDGARDGSEVRAENLSVFLAERGHSDWAPKTILDLRRTAHQFPPLSRERGCSFVAHRIAGTPEVLQEAIRRNSGKPPSTRFMEQFKRDLREQEEAAERKRQADARRRAEETERKAHERARAAADEQARIRAQEQARKAELRRRQLEQEHEEAERKRKERQQREADTKAERIAKELEDRDVAEALARSRSTGARRVTNAVHENEAARRRKVREGNDQRRDAEALPLPAYVTKMIADIDAWVIALRSITDDDLAGLPAENRFVRQLAMIVDDLAEEALRWNTALGENTSQPSLEVIDGTAKDGPRRRLTA